MKYFLSLIMLAVFSFSSTAQDAVALRKKHFNLENGLAIQGYDPVAYFTQSKAVKGKKELAVSYQGILYYFSCIFPEDMERSYKIIGDFK